MSVTQFREEVVKRLLKDEANVISKDLAPEQTLYLLEDLGW